jgi:isoprenylcysteine carboxyl methyltransferase (ICMT) family protein YpbQ
VTSLIILALLAAILVMYATVVLVWSRSRRRWPRVAAVAGGSSVVVGIALYFVMSLIGLSYYDEGADDPTWFTTLVVLALVLAGGGVLAIVSAALGAAWRTPRQG